MMKKFKHWLVHRFLPVWAQETLLAENKKLKDEVKQLREQLSELMAYTDGLEVGIRAQRRIIINTGEGSR